MKVVPAAYLDGILITNGDYKLKTDEYGTWLANENYPYNHVQMPCQWIKFEEYIGSVIADGKAVY